MRLNAKVLLITGVVAVVVIGLCAVAVVNPGQVLSGALRREAFFAGRPTSYWISEIQRSTQDGSSLRALAEPEAREVLVECLRSPDQSVRRAAARLLELLPASSQTLPALMSLLSDPDSVLQGSAILCLAKLNATARPAVPRLQTLARSDEVAVQAYAQYALWEIAPTVALTAEEWNEFRSPEFLFKIQMPGTVAREESSAPGQDGDVPVTSFHADSAICHYVVAVSPIAPEVLSSVDDWQIWLEDSQRVHAESLGQEFVLFTPFDRNGLSGFESIIKAYGENGNLELEIRTHLYIWDDLLYQVIVSYPSRDALSNVAAEHYFGSFDVEKRPEL